MPHEAVLEALDQQSCGEMNSFEFRGFLWWYRVLNGSRFSPPSLTGRISHSDTRGNGEILRKMKMEEMEPIKWLIVSRGSD